MDENCMTPSFETVILTYRKDFEKLQRCLESIVQHGLGHDTEPIHIIVNDYPPACKDVQEFIPNDPRFCVWSYEEFGQWKGQLDWYSQQWFKLVVSNIVLSEWYLLIDCDIILQKPIRHKDMFTNNRAHYNKTNIDFKNANLVRRLSSAYRHWNDTMDDQGYFMTDLTPFIMHTQTVKEMLPQIDPELFDRSKDKITAEFFLWSAYLDHRGIKDKLYHPIKNTTNRMFNTWCPN
jgi:hypothetical protein